MTIQPIGNIFRFIIFDFPNLWIYVPFHDIHQQHHFVAGTGTTTFCTIDWCFAGKFLLLHCLSGQYVHYAEGKTFSKALEASSTPKFIQFKNEFRILASPCTTYRIILLAKHVLDVPIGFSAGGIHELDLERFKIVTETVISNCLVLKTLAEQWLLLRVKVTIFKIEMYRSTATCFELCFLSSKMWIKSIWWIFFIQSNSSLITKYDVTLFSKYSFDWQFNRIDGNAAPSSLKRLNFLEDSTDCLISYILEKLT